MLGFILLILVSSLVGVCVMAYVILDIITLIPEDEHTAMPPEYKKEAADFFKTKFKELKAKYPHKESK